MAFLLKVKKKNTTYYYIARSVRVNGTSKHEILCSLGTVADIMEKYQIQSPPSDDSSTAVKKNGN
jgi:hypothetical protein